MNIIHFIHTYIPIFGGTTTRLINLYSNDGNNHTMIVPFSGSQYVPPNISNLNKYDTYDNINEYGNAVLIDETSNSTVAAVLIQN